MLAHFVRIFRAGDYIAGDPQTVADPGASPLYFCDEEGNSMVTISLCMIVKNEEAVLRRCLQSIAPAVDEIIIVDTGSTDSTKDIALDYTDKVYDFDWIDDFAAARNISFAHATMDYQMWLDADDVLAPEQRDRLIELKKTLDPATDMVTMLYNTHFDAAGNPVLVSMRERLLRRDRHFLWQDPVHECIPLSGNILHSDITIDHRKEKHEGVSERNLRIYERLESSGATLTPRQLYYYARELRDHGRFERAAEFFERFLATDRGWKEDNIAACHALALCLRALGERERSFDALLSAFRYGSPRAEILTEIGYHFKLSANFAEAAQWFQAAADLTPPQVSGFLLRDYWGYIPHIELCVCYYNIGDLAKAREHNRLAGLCKPGNAAVEENERFFASLCVA